MSWEPAFKYKTELNPDGTPKVKEETVPGAFTVSEETLGIEPAANATGTTATPAEETTGVMAPAPRKDINAEDALGDGKQETFPEYQRRNGLAPGGTNASTPPPASKEDAGDDNAIAATKDLKEVTISAKRPDKKEPEKPAGKTSNNTAPNSSPAPNVWREANGTYNDVQEIANAIKEQQERERMQEQQKAERQRHDDYVATTNKELEEARKGPADANQANLEEQKYLEEHPWVLEEDYSTMRNKYKDKKWSQIVSDVADYRRKIGKPMSYEEQMMMLSQYPGNTSKKEELREKRLAYWADALNQMGNVLAHFYNYGRAKAGSPAAQITDNKSSYSERLRAADMAMRQRGYNDYVNAVVNEQKRKQTREDMEYRLKMQQAQEQRRLANQMELKRMEWMSPKYKKELERLDLDLQDKQIQKELHELQKAFQMMKNETAKDHAFEMFVRKNGGKGGGGSKTAKPYTYNGIGYTSDYAAYKDAMIAQGMQPLPRQKWDKQKDKRKLLKDAGVTIHGVD